MWQATGRRSQRGGRRARAGDADGERLHVGPEFVGDLGGLAGSGERVGQGVDPDEPPGGLRLHHPLLPGSQPRVGRHRPPLDAHELVGQRAASLGLRQARTQWTTRRAKSAWPAGPADSSPSASFHCASTVKRRNMSHTLRGGSDNHRGDASSSGEPTSSFAEGVRVLVDVTDRLDRDPGLVLALVEQSQVLLLVVEVEPADLLSVRIVHEDSAI